jgi:hypothetical protein
MSSPPLNLRPAAQGPILSHHKNKLALFWLTTAVGAVLFVALQSFSYVNDYVKAHGTTPTITFESGALWMFSIFYGAWIVTVLLALIGTVRSQWTALILGGLLVFVNSFTGVFDGLRDGGHIAFSALFFITLPGVCAIVATWRHLKQKGTHHVDE